MVPHLLLIVLVVAEAAVPVRVAVTVAARVLPEQMPVAVSLRRAVVAVAAAVQRRVHSVAVAARARADVSRSAQSVKSLNSRTHPSLVAFRFLVAMDSRSASVRAPLLLTSLRRSTLIPQRW